MPLSISPAVVRSGERDISQPFLERRIVGKHLEQIRVVAEQADHKAAQSAIMLDSRDLPIRIRNGVLIGRVSCYPLRNVFRDQRMEFATHIEVAQDIVCNPPDEVCNAIKLCLFYSRLNDHFHVQFNMVIGIV